MAEQADLLLDSAGSLQLLEGTPLLINEVEDIRKNINSIARKVAEIQKADQRKK